MPQTKLTLNAPARASLRRSSFPLGSSWRYMSNSLRRVRLSTYQALRALITCLSAILSRKLPIISRSGNIYVYIILLIYLQYILICMFTYPMVWCCWYCFCYCCCYWPCCCCCCCYGLYSHTDKRVESLSVLKWKVALLLLYLFRCL